MYPFGNTDYVKEHSCNLEIMPMNKKESRSKIRVLTLAYENTYFAEYLPGDGLNFPAKYLNLAMPEWDFLLSCVGQKNP